MMYIVYTQAMDTVMSATEARKRFFEVINWARTTESEIVVEKNGQPAVVISGARPVKSKAEIKEAIANFRKVMSKFPRGALEFDTVKWQEKERKYLANIAKGRLRGE